MVWQSYTGESDEVRLSRYDGRWKTYARVPGATGDVWRPQVALDASRRPWVVWSQQIDGNFDIYARALNHRENEWDDLVRLSSHPNPDINSSLVSDAEGGLWVVWQGFRGDNSDIFLRHYDGQQWSREIQVTADPANDWEPQVAVDSQGRAQVVWDSYRNGNSHCRPGQRLGTPGCRGQPGQSPGGLGQLPQRELRRLSSVCQRRHSGA